MTRCKIANVYNKKPGDKIPLLCSCLAVGHYRYLEICEVVNGKIVSKLERVRGGQAYVLQTSHKVCPTSVMIHAKVGS